MADKAKITAKENVFSLELSGVQKGESGQYSCRVTDGNQVTITCSANLEVHSRKFYFFNYILLFEKLLVYNKITKHHRIQKSLLFTYWIVTPAERKDREASNTPIFVVKLRDADLILDSTASLMLHVHGNPNPTVEL